MESRKRGVPTNRLGMVYARAQRSEACITLADKMFFVKGRKGGRPYFLFYYDKDKLSSIK